MKLCSLMRIFSSNYWFWILVETENKIEIVCKQVCYYLFIYLFAYFAQIWCCLLLCTAYVTVWFGSDRNYIPDQASCLFKTTKKRLSECVSPTQTNRTMFWDSWKKCTKMHEWSILFSFVCIYVDSGLFLHMRYLM